MENRFEDYHKKLKKQRIIKNIVGGILAGSLLLGTSNVIKNEKNKNKNTINTAPQDTTTEEITSQSSIDNFDIEQQSSIYEDFKIRKTSKKIEQEAIADGKYSLLEFSKIKYGEKYYLTINEQDLYFLIKDAIEETEQEYTNIGATPVFSVNDSTFSHITAETILALFKTETDFRLIELKNENSSIYNVDNYKDFYGYANGIRYNGLGMMSENAINDLVERDRKTVNKFKNYEYISIDDEQVKITFTNLSPYQYLMACGAKNEGEIKEALAENIKLTAKCAYIMLNRTIKDEIKYGKHTEAYQQLCSTPQLKKYSNVEKQIWFALLCYNEGSSKISSALSTGELFSVINTNENKEYKFNLKYPEKAMEFKDEYSTLFSDDLLLN